MALAAATALAGSLAMPGPAPGSGAAAGFRVGLAARPSTVLVGHSTTLSGAVRPRAAHARVKVQVSADGAWRTVAVVRLGARSRYVATYLPPAAGTYLLRVRKPPAHGLGRGISRTVTVVATPSLPPT